MDFSSQRLSWLIKNQWLSSHINYFYLNKIVHIILLIRAIRTASLLSNMEEPLNWFLHIEIIESFLDLTITTTPLACHLHRRINLDHKGPHPQYITIKFRLDGI